MCFSLKDRLFQYLLSIALNADLLDRSAKKNKRWKMRQFQFTVNDQSNLSGEIKKIRHWCQENKASGVLFQVYTEMLDRDRFEAIFQTIDKEMPDAEYVGCSSNGNIVGGDFSGESIAVICTVFEHPTTQIEVLQYPLCSDQPVFLAP